MEQITINVYKFEELSEEAKKVAIKHERNYRQTDGEPLMFFRESCEDKAKEHGFEIENRGLTYSLFYSQGDGLSFSGNYLETEKLFNEVLGQGKEKTAKLLTENCTLIIKQNRGHYCYASKSDVDLYLENYTSSINVVNTNNIDIVVGKVLNIIEDKYMALCKELERMGYAEIEWYSSDETIIEELQNRDSEYTEDGKIYEY